MAVATIEALGAGAIPQEGGLSFPSVKFFRRIKDTVIGWAIPKPAVLEVQEVLTPRKPAYHEFVQAYAWTDQGAEAVLSRLAGIRELQAAGKLEKSYTNPQLDNIQTVVSSFLTNRWGDFLYPNPTEAESVNPT